MRKRVLTILIILLLAFIWGNSTLSRETSGMISDTVMGWMNRAAAALGLGDEFFTVMVDLDDDGDLDASSHIVRKIAHVTEFALLGALLWFRLEGAGWKRALTAFGLTAAAAGTDELIQLFFDRGSQLRDVFIDSGGAVLGISMAALFAARRKKRRK